MIPNRNEFIGTPDPFLMTTRSLGHLAHQGSRVSDQVPEELHTTLRRNGTLRACEIGWAR